ncbi:calcium-binding protein [Streptomyces griseorubiginosus]|uniref:calcium-binding protein n=1 Tax=Streptomyces griseorubiginosus TaxID=67304 RepID=UPI002E80A44F|nr:calcium-binding protein [Streptomyces griseorubiginosus]WUB44647.1 calcium-binding protein [Streptomyces griseorubiginosus]WUB53164.1 calcium-binding protein [Streptomyces griseorubiginosus]
MFTVHARPAPRRQDVCRRRSLLARAGTVTATVLALILTLPGTAAAAPGDLDTSFSGDGKVLTRFADDDQANDVAVQPDGKIVSVGSSGDQSVIEGRWALTRHNADGTPDTGFGDGGTVTTAINNMDPNLQWSEANAVALQPDGKIVVVGYSWREYENCCWFVVARYNADGTLDNGFSGDGRYFADIDGPTEARDVAIDPSGRIVAAGYTGGDMAVLRLNADGTPDTTFGGDGTVTANPAGPTLQEGGDGRALALQSDGKIVVGGEVGSTRFDFALMRFNPNGSVDTSFDGDGIVRTDFGDYEAVEALAIQPDGKIVAAGGNSLARYNPNGSLDTGFDGDGKVVPSGVGVWDLALQPGDGRIVLAGGGGPGDFAVQRYNPDGSQDTGFGTGGTATADFGGADSARGVALQPDGRIVAAGRGGPDSGFALARFLGGGTVPPPPAGVDLSVTKSGPATVSIGDRATYTVTVTNNSTTTNATGVSLTDTFTGPPGTVISATPSQGTCTTAVTCALGTLAPGAKATVTVVAEPRATGILTERATATATQSDPATANNTATVATTVNNARGCTRIGTSGNDSITGTSGNDVICALSGDDTVNAGSGNDTVHAGHGNDRVDGGLGNDTLNAGPGNDTLTGNYGTDNLNTVDSVSGNDTANGGPNTDTCTTDQGDIRVSCP